MTPFDVKCVRALTIQGSAIETRYSNRKVGSTKAGLGIRLGILWLNDNVSKMRVNFLRADLVRGFGSNFIVISQF